MGPTPDRPAPRRAGPVAVTTPTSPVGLLVRRPALRVDPSMTLAAASSLMDREGVSSLLVDRDDAIVTERDIVRAVAAGRSGQVPVAAVATPHAVTVGATTSIVEAAGLMLNEHIRHLLVQLPGGELGMLSLRDVVAVLLQVADPNLWLSSLRMTIDLTTASEVWIG